MNLNEAKDRLERVLSGQTSRESFCEWFLAAKMEHDVCEPIVSNVETDLANLQIDVDRPRRCDFGEVVFGEGKTPSTVVAAVGKLLESQSEVLVTRADDATFDATADAFDYVRQNSNAKTIRIGKSNRPVASDQIENDGCQVGVISAGTTDNGVLEEAVDTLAWMGIATYVTQDAGVAGPYRLLPHLPKLRNCVAVIVVAGMEGALPSVVGGHLAQPIIAVPTSVGYGASFNGLAALLSMINSCAANVTAVNIDGGFCGAFVAGAIVNQIRKQIAIRSDSNEHSC